MRGYVKLIDFGIAKRLDQDWLDFLQTMPLVLDMKLDVLYGNLRFWHPMLEDGRTFTCIGSPHYMAPEDGPHE